MQNRGRVKKRNNDEHQEVKGNRLLARLKTHQGVASQGTEDEDEYSNGERKRQKNGRFRKKTTTTTNLK